jgi:hypothetical protein
MNALQKYLIQLKLKVEKASAELRDEYQVDEDLADPDHLHRALDDIMNAQTYEEGNAKAHKAFKKYEFFCIAQLAHGRARLRKPETALSLEEEAKAKERFADLAGRKGYDDKADELVEEATKLRKKAAKLRKDMK